MMLDNKNEQKWPLTVLMMRQLRVISIYPSFLCCAVRALFLRPFPAYHICFDKHCTADYN